MRRSVAVVGPVSPDEAWDRYAVIARWPSWAPPIRSVDSSAPRLAAGVTGLVRGPGGLRVRFVVERVDEGARTWTWRVRSGPLRMALTHEVLATASGGTAATLVVEASAPLALIYPGLARFALARLVRDRTRHDLIVRNQTVRNQTVGNQTVRNQTVPEQTGRR